MHNLQERAATIDRLWKQGGFHAGLQSGEIVGNTAITAAEIMAGGYTLTRPVLKFAGRGGVILARETAVAIRDYSPIVFQFNTSKAITLSFFGTGDLPLVKLRKLLGSKASSINVWTVKSRMKKAQLPNEGRIRYVPRPGYNPENQLPRGNYGFKDKFGNEWVKGPSRTTGKPFEWNVQLSETGKLQLGHLSRDGKHINVSMKGHITHF